MFILFRYISKSTHTHTHTQDIKKKMFYTKILQ